MGPVRCTRIGLMFWLLAGLSGCGVLSAQELDPKVDRLCAHSDAPEKVPDKIHPDCQIETGSAARDAAAASAEPLTVVAWNIERGMKLKEQIQLLQTQPPFSQAQVILLGEADRGCSRTGYVHVAREMARALNMHWAFAVEYVELPRPPRKAVNDISSPCEHGNAVLSRFPISGARQLRHAKANDWFHHSTEPRLGGNVVVAADLKTPKGPLRVYAVHFESDAKHEPLRQAQAMEVVADAASIAGPVVVGGDMNTLYLVMDLMSKSRRDTTVPVFLGAGFADAHAALAKNKRGTTNRAYGVRGVIDLIFMKHLSVVESGVCPPQWCEALSDHLAVWTQLAWPP